MQILEEIYKNNPPLYPIEEFCERCEALYIDIETTGLNKESTSLYLIGCGYYIDDDFYTRLFFADNESEELDVLLAYLDFQKRFTTLFHFNGNKFDIPYLKYKAAKYNLGDIFEGLCQIDVYAMIKPLRYLLFPDSMRQKVVEDFLDIDREDKFNGGELIEVYKRYTMFQNKNDLRDLITHNREDVLGMHKILPILYYLRFKDEKLSYSSHYINEFIDYMGETEKEVIFTYNFNIDIPKSFFTKTETMYIKVSAQCKTVTIRLPLICGNMKMFFDNYRDYYYLPEEDTCIIRSLCSCMPKSQYIKATKENCYQNISGTFLKQPDKIFSPSLKASYKDKASYFRFPEDFNDEGKDEFGTKLLQVFFHIKRPSVRQ